MTNGVGDLVKQFYGVPISSKGSAEALVNGEFQFRRQPVRCAPKV